MGIQTYSIFLQIALEEGIGVMELTKRLDVSGASASRNVLLLSKERTSKRKGYNLVQTDYDPQERRRKMCSLTAPGRKLLTKLSQLILPKPSLRSASG
jgi:DNA-binding MarR family transcriptional regulator